MMSTIFCEPTRQGTHLPQDSFRKKRVKFRAASIMQRPVLRKRIAPDPMCAPASITALGSEEVEGRKSIGESRNLSVAGRKGKLGPEGAKALSWPRGPPALASISR